MKDLHILGVDVDPLLVERAVIASQENPNVTFQTLDLMSKNAAESLNSYLEAHGKKRFDFVFCFSVSMWIHLNHGDTGLKDFIEKLAGVSKNFLLEPQPWKCYQTAARRMRKLSQPEFEHMSAMKHTGEKLEPFIKSICDSQGFKIVKELGVTNWKRKLLHFKNKLPS